MKTGFFQGKAVPFLLLALAGGCGGKDSSPLDLGERQGGVVNGPRCYFRDPDGNKIAFYLR